MNKKAIIIIAAVVLLGGIIYLATRRRNGAGTSGVQQPGKTSILNFFMKSPPGKGGVSGTDSGFEIPVDWIYGPNEEGVDHKVITVTNE